MASEQFEKFLQRLWAHKAPEGKINVASMRTNMDSVGGRLPEGVSSTPGELGGVGGEWVRPDGAAEDRALLYLHGGGYVAGSVDSHRNLLGHVAAALQAPVFAANYRLAPEHPHPAAVTDATAAYRALLDEGFPASKLAIAGDSAGGGLTLAVLVALRDAGDPLPACAVPISAWTDMEGTGDSMSTRADVDPMVSATSLKLIAGKFLGESGDPQDPLASPLRADVSGLCPIMLQVGDAEVLLDDSVRMADRISKAGGSVRLEAWPEMVHVWHSAAGFVPEADQAVAQLAGFVHEHW